MRAIWALAGLGVGALLASGQLSAQQQQPGNAGCSALAASQWLSSGKVESANWVPADAAKSLPAFCEVKAALNPAPGSQIGVVFRLPENWNGKLLGLGGGGWAGNVTLQAAEPGLKRGYATAQTDGGHASTSPWETGWASNPEAVTDFAYRAVHEMTVAGKAAVQRYYGKAHDKAYFQGCSTGGRMALMEAQRFPEDYDGIISGAPVYSLQVQTSALVRNAVFSQPGAAFSPAQLKLAQNAAVQACDAKDGLKDGLIADPATCEWRPEELACQTGQGGDSCLAPAQVAALRKLYDGAKAPDGSWANFPLNKGGEAGWSMFIATAGGEDQTRGGGLIGLAPVIFPDRKVDLANLSVDNDVPAVRSSAFAKQYEAIDPNLQAFVARGGKLILWHGQSDPGPTPAGTLAYYNAAQKAAPDAVTNGVRLFLAPGVGHCSGGPGPDRLELLPALEEWVEKGTAPATMLATKANGSITRPLCPYPTYAHYKGLGDPNSPKSFGCRKAS